MGSLNERAARGSAPFDLDVVDEHRRSRALRGEAGLRRCSLPRTGLGSHIVIFRFADNEVDGKRCELRRGGVVQALQPQAYAVLEYLVRHRDRVVTKQEARSA